MEKVSKRKRILYYNWTQFDKIYNSGGGVNVYQKNLIDYMVNNTDNEIYFLSSGIYYDIFNKKTYFEETKNIYGDKCKSFKIVNSTCVAPAKAMYDNIETYLNDDVTYNLLKKFIEQQGEFDIIHFNNIEGLSSKCLEIKKDFPNTKVIFSVHNYFLFCPQINLFFNNECNCVDYEHGEKCVQCLKTSISKKKSIMYYKIDRICEKLKIPSMSNKIKRVAKKINSKINANSGKTENKNIYDNKVFMKYRKINVERINQYVDVVLAVSEKVKDISIKMGINNNKIFTNYIGTVFAENSINHVNAPINEEYLVISYMGYFEKMKGFDFLIDALERIPIELSKKIKFKCYAKIKNPEDINKVERIIKLKERLYSSEHFDGYNHNELKKILSDVNLGIIPVVWEDNLPQIAIEYVAHGVPILCSDLGGAHELSNSKYFIFESGNIEDFKEKLTKIMEDKNLLNEYYNSNMKLVSMKEHIDKLLSFYE